MDYSDTEVKILGAALSEFARKGKDGARMQEIADRAEINKAMLHYYFRSKDRLYDAVFTHVMSRFLASLAEALRDAGTFAETLRRFIDLYVDFVRGNPDVVRLFINENLAGGSVMGQHVREEMERSELAPPRLFARKMAEAAARGEIRAADPVQTLLTVISGCVLPVVVQPTVRAFDPEAAERWDAFLDARKAHLFDLVYSGLRPRS